MLFVCKNDVQSVANRELNYASDLLILEGDRIDEMELANSENQSQFSKDMSNNWEMAASS